MALAGSRFGPYEILAPLGAGGMGEVYRAYDSRLKREVALKIMRPETLVDPVRRKRFQQEAQAASALNHPNILVVHDIGSENGVHYIVSELVAGTTLRKLIQNGPLPIKQLLDLASQVADGLQTAHQAGIVHRDLKPENIMIGQDGRARILDFGLAKLREQTGGEQDETTSRALTKEGVMVGTVPYMSPEQAMGKDADFRSDQFSFGLILYEMATGKRAFARGTAAETLAAILREEPASVSTLNSEVPAPLRWLIERCLAKEPGKRYASTSDLYRDLHDVREHLSEVTPTGGATPLISRSVKSKRAIIAALIGFVLLIAVAAIFLWQAAPTTTAVRVKPLPTFQRLTFERGQISDAKFSPDGQTILYTASWNGKPYELFSTRPGGAEGRSLGISPADILAVSSSGEMALLVGDSQTTMARAPLAGGALREVLDNVESADWSPDGKQLAIVRNIEGVRRLEFPIGKTLYSSNTWISDPHMSHNGDLIAFVDHPIAGTAEGFVAVVDLAGKKRTVSRNWPGMRGLAWSPDDEIWFTAREGTSAYALYAVTLTGKERLLQRAPGDLMLHDISQSGKALLSIEHYAVDTFALLAGESKERDLTWLDNSTAIDLSADGRFLLLNRFGAGAGATHVAYLRNTDGSPAIRLGEGMAAALSADAKWVIAISQTIPAQLILLPTGAGEQKLIPRYSIEKYRNIRWFQDGKRILFTGNETGQPPRLYVQNIEHGEPASVSQDSIRSEIAVSPDGKLTAAVRGNKIMFYPIDKGTPVPAPGTVAGDQPIRWSTDGHFLFVWRDIDVSRKIFRVNLSTGHRELWKEITPELTGLSSITSPILSEDAKSYVYSCSRTLSDLYLVDGLQ